MYKMPFGKYKNLSPEDVAKQGDLGHLEWFVKVPLNPKEEGYNMDFHEKNQKLANEIKRIIALYSTKEEKPQQLVVGKAEVSKADVSGNVIFETTVIDCLKSIQADISWFRELKEEDERNMRRNWDAA